MKFRVSPVIGIPLSILLFLSACALFSQVYTWLVPEPKKAAVSPPAAAPAAVVPVAPAKTSPPVAVAAVPVSNPAAPPAQATPAKLEGPVIETLELKGVDIGYSPNNFLVEKAGRYKIKLINKGTILHDVTFADGTKIEAKAGETVEGDVMVPPNGLAFICSLPGHKEAGMVGAISVKGSAAVANAAGGSDHGGPAPASDILPDPKAAAPVLYNPAAPKALPGTTHDIDLVVKEVPMTVAKGFVQAVWTFGGTVPGPVIRVKVGDTVRIHLKNPKESRLPHSVDFHSSMVAWNDEMTSINPGEEKLYEYKAEFAGVWMYHCSTAPTLHHITNGMYGMMIVEPKEGLPPVDKEFAFVQSEWYLGPQNEPSSLSKAAAGAPSPDYVVFNGVANQYVDNPIEIGVNKRVRAFVLNAGPNIDSSFHIVGTIFDTVIKEGVSLSPDNKGHWGSQAVDLSPAQGAIVEFSMAEDGLYPIVTHAFNFVGRGALGLFKAGTGDPKVK